jgi:hypothetical protein
MKSTSFPILALSVVLTSGTLFAAPFPTYEALMEGPLARHAWQGYDFVFYKWGPPTEREYHEFGAHNLLTPTWKDPEFLDYGEVGEWDWKFHHFLTLHDGIREHLATSDRRTAYHAAEIFYRQFYGEVKRSISPTLRNQTTMLSFPGQFNFASYDGVWGIDMVGHEIGINAVGFQSKLAYLRGSARQNARPFFVDVSPWYIDYGIWARGEDREPSGFTQYYKGLPETEFPPEDLPIPRELGVGGRAGWWNGGHSASFMARCWYMSWLWGATVIVPEACQHNFFAYDPEYASEKGTGNGFVPNDPDQRATLSPMGERAQEFMRITTTYPHRGIPYAPFAILVDQYAGFNGSQCADNSGFEGTSELTAPPRPWGVLDPTLGDREMYLFFDTIWPESMYLQLLIGRNQGGIVNSDNRMVHSAYGDTFDVLMSNASDDVLQAYPVLICIGDHEFLPETTARMEHYLKKGGRVYLTYAQAEQLGDTLSALRAAGPVELYGLDAAHMPEVVDWKRWMQPFLPVSVADDAEIRRREEGLKLLPYEIHFKQEVERIMAPLVKEFLPITVDGDIHYMINRTADGWVIGLINHAGSDKTPYTPVVIDPAQARTITVTLQTGTLTGVKEWMTESALPHRKNQTRVVVPPGEVRILMLSDR